MLEGGHNQERREPALVILPAAVFLVGLVAGCTAHESIRPDATRPVKTMVLVSADEPQGACLSWKGGSVEEGRAGVPGPGPAGPSAGKGRTKSPKGRNDCPTQAGRISSPF